MDKKVRLQKISQQVQKIFDEISKLLIDLEPAEPWKSVETDPPPTERLVEIFDGYHYTVGYFYNTGRLIVEQYDTTTNPHRFDYFEVKGNYQWRNLPIATRNL